MTRLMRTALAAALVAAITACASASVPATTAPDVSAVTSPPSAPTTITPTTEPTATAQVTTPSPAVGAPSEVQSGTAPVEIGDNFYLPELVIVTAGTRVRWVNRGQMTHTASARDESFGSGNMEFGQAYERVFALPGRYTYYCVQHEDMIGIVEVR
jgi:plastocyanin